MTDVVSILEAEGFLASEKQVVDHLKAWPGNFKYLSRMDKLYIMRKLMERSCHNKRTSFRNRVTRAKISSSRIRRVLKKYRKDIDLPATASVLSSQNVSAYTGSTGLCLSSLFKGYSTPKRRRGRRKGLPTPSLSKLHICDSDAI